MDSYGLVIETGYAADLEAGMLGINDSKGWDQRVKIENRIEDMIWVASPFNRVVSDA